MKIYGELTQQEKNIMSSKVAFAKFKRLVLAGDKQGVQQMLLWDAIFIPMIRTIVEEYPAYTITLDYDFNMDNTRGQIYDMHKFVKDFFKWADKVHPGRYTSNEDFITAHHLEKEVGWA